jgi:hypothetical protein
VSDRPAGYFYALAAREGPAGEGDLNREPLAPGAVRTGGAPLAMSVGEHALITGGNPLVIGEAKLSRHGADVFATGEIWTDMQLGAEVATMLKHRGINAGISLGYRTLAAADPTAAQRAKGIKRVLTDVLPIELSHVLSPAQPWARVLEVKSSLQEVEDRLGLLLERRAMRLAALNRDADLMFAVARRLRHAA